MSTNTNGLRLVVPPAVVDFVATVQAGERP
jgi:hypothetical protein